MAKQLKPLITLIVTSIVLLSALPALGQSADLMKYATPESKVFIGLNMQALRGTQTFAELLAVAKQDATIRSTLELLQDEAGLNIEKDVNSILFAMPETVQNPNAKGANDTMLMVLNGKFNQEKFIAAAKKHEKNVETITKKGQVARHSNGDFSFGFAGKGTDLIMTFGDTAFQTNVWKVVNGGPAASKDKVVKKLLTQINTKRSLWMIGITEGLTQQGPKMNSAGMTVDVRKGLTVNVAANMASKKDAESAEQEFSAIKQQASNPMVAMVGATPLINNLKISRTKTVINMSTKMSAAEFTTMRTQIKQILAQGAQPMAPAGAQSVPQGKDGTPAPATGKKKGAAADFN